MANWDNMDASGDVEDRRGLSAPALFSGGGGIVALLLAFGLNYLGLNVSPDQVQQGINTVNELRAGQASQREQPAEFKGLDSYEVFTKRVVGSTNAVWSDVFAQNGKTYRTPTLVLFRDGTQSGCGIASSQVGPFFCPSDKKIYLDETFFDELHTRFGADTGQVTQAYVIAHEVGHNVQDQLGLFDNFNQNDQSASIEAELQADCYAGVWAFAEAKNGVFANGEINQAIDAAKAVGDDNIQSRTSGRVNQEQWTHGSSAERAAAFTKGYQSGKPEQCVDLQR